MEIRIISIENKADKNLKELIHHYLKQIPFRCSLVDIKCNSVGNEFSQKDLEADQILKKINSDEFLIAMDQKGTLFTSEEFSNKIFSIHHPNISFIIGGAFGLSERILTKANSIISLSKMTFPHKLAKLVLIEQIYRSHKIKINHPYHK